MCSEGSNENSNGITHTQCGVGLILKNNYMFKCYGPFDIGTSGLFRYERTVSIYNVTEGPFSFNNSWKMGSG